MKRRAVFGQWKTPPQVLYPSSSSSSGMKKSASTPAFPSGLGGSVDMTTGSEFGKKNDSGRGSEFAESFSNFHPRRQQMADIDPLDMDDFMETSSGRPFSMMDDVLDGLANGPDDPFTVDGHVGRKRTVQGLTRMKSEQGSPNPLGVPGPRRDDPFFAGEDILGNSYSCPDFANLKHVKGPAHGGDLDGPENAEARKQKRLARNRAAARIRRQRRKTIVDTLERELVDLNRSIVFLRKINEFKKKENQKARLGGYIGVLSVPTSVVKSAHDTANEVDVKVANGVVTTTSSFEPVSSNKPSVMQRAGSKSSVGREMNGDGDAKPSVPVNPFAGSDCPKHIRSDDDARKVLLGYLVGNSQESNSLSMTRRRAAIQLFLDRQIKVCHKLATAGMVNCSPGSLLFNETHNGDGMDISENIRATTELLTAMKLSVTHHVNGSPAHQKENSLNGKPATASAVKLNSEKPTPSEPPNLNVPGRYMREGVLKQQNIFGEFTRTSAAASQDPKVADQLAHELAQTLNLAGEQKAQLHQLSQGLQREQIKLQALQRISLSFACHGWLEYDTIEQAQGQFRGLLSARQMEHFYNFIVKNQEQINKLKLSIN
mmetsp:Transcript_2222/g.2544  ORF Transcript_2222/g.2544 Transcript_2222/m.2544 type:complete len:600 (+) Transcript_2222:429-2228(+)